MTSKSLQALALVASALAGTTAFGTKPQPAAPPAPPTAAPAPPSEFHWQEGPRKVDLGNNVDLDLPEEFLFLGVPEADKLLQKLGNFHNENVRGVIAPKDETKGYFVVVNYDPVGYVKDDEKINADDLIKTFRENQEEANKQRVEKGFNALTIEGWAEPPHYEKSLHQLVWGLTVLGKKNSVNYNTRILGRRGYVALNFVTGTDTFAQDKPVAAKLLAATTFRQGSRYQDFDKSKGDKVAEYGLVGLVLGGLGVAKLVKIGLIAKFWKLIVLGIAGAFAAIKKFFGGKADAPPPPPAA